MLKFVFAALALVLPFFTASAEPLFLASFFEFDHYQRLEPKNRCTLELERNKKGEYRIVSTEPCRGLQPRLEKEPNGRLKIHVSTRFPRDTRWSTLAVHYQLRADDGSVRNSGSEYFPSPIFDSEDRFIYVQPEALLEKTPHVYIPCDPVIHFSIRGNLGSFRDDISLKVVLDSEQIKKTMLVWEIWMKFSESYLDLQNRQVRVNDSIYIDDVKQDPVIDTCTGLPVPPVSPAPPTPKP